jgi:hypothetical protein
MERLRRDIEWWSAELERDSAVALLVLGDIIYPIGLSPPGRQTFDTDTAVVMGQVRLVGGPSALARSARAYFMAGNHDWGLREDWEGFVRLASLEAFLTQAAAQTGAKVELAPRAGSGGPTVVDWGRHHRIVILDTAWWLLEGVTAGRREVLRGIEEAFASAGERELIVAAHHPFKSGGPHGGGGFSFWETLGVRYILFRSGAILQDLTSRPYRDLETGLRRIFERHGPPLVFVGGHEHSLQVIRGIEPTDPRHNLVSGAGSKLSAIGSVEGMLFAQSAPGYMRLVIERNGRMSLFVEAGPPEYLSCPESEPDRTTCMTEGVAAFQTVYSGRLHGSAETSTPSVDGSPDP